MSKKFVRGITDIKTINNQDLDTNNVNDLLSDGKHNYIHRKKSDGSEEYHNLTNNLKTIQSDDTDLLTVTNYNNTTNSATIRPNHDAQKEQVLESTDNTIVITHGENGTEETTSVDINPDKVLTHDNLKTGYGISKSTSGNNTTLSLEYTRVENGFDLNTLANGNVRAAFFTNAPSDNTWYFVSAYSEQRYTIQNAVKLLDNKNVTYRRLKYDGVWGEWREQVGDKSVIANLLAQKQNTLTSNASIGVDGTGLRQLYTQSETYTHANATLKTHVKSVSNSTTISTAEEEFNFLAKMDKGKTTASFILNEHDAYAFRKLIDTYGENGTIVVSTCMFSMDQDTSILTFLCNQSTTTNHPYVISFSDIMSPPPSTNSQQQPPSATTNEEKEQTE